MTDLLAEISAWSILKWAVIVLVAGFIGQFGKSLAQAVMKRMRLKKEEEAKSRRETADLSFGPDISHHPGKDARDVDPSHVKALLQTERGEGSQKGPEGPSEEPEKGEKKDL
jgi:hypothetical protein